MGPSGSGKTTLLNVLAHRTATSNAKVSGQLLVDDEAVSQAAFRSIASFVEQEDALIGSLTARETIEIAAHLSRPRFAISVMSRIIVNTLVKVLKSTAQSAYRVPPDSLRPQFMLGYSGWNTNPEGYQWRPEAQS